MFLSTQELVQLTGRKVKAKQIVALRSMGVPFFVNALGQPVVTRAAVEGRAPVTNERAGRASWQPRVVAG
ncbi:DUF4224 domain-containing protein [Paraburkholderia phenoliruptrix]|uniref:DUF4224 domain-containing protein n=1 Tax=Paraburkholderia phenoliruptrix TaxID=252970 RepID=UPI001C6F2D24|nr:DUF4224 domain-containing protein [Paraburkholderia phenoliruptrix]MBW9106207.1 DUF4224 domain-containing protein [Paraburkholderia phenoliruptrix]MBW9130859.1 DUF4224 domain-containing protein [Paraburkholderia ginsengiterrae]